MLALIAYISNEIGTSFLPNSLIKISVYTVYSSGQDIMFGIAARYWLDSPGIKSWWGGEIFCAIQIILKSHPLSLTMGTGSFLGLKQLECGADHLPPSAEWQMGWSYTTSSPMCCIVL